jgi:hypothetical protein
MGLTDWTIRSGYVRVLHGVYVSEGVRITPTLRARAALLVAPPGAVVSRQSAAALWGGVVPTTSDVQLSIPAGRRVRRDGLDVREAPHSHQVNHDGILVTPPTQTFLDLGAELDLVELVVLGDSLVRREHVSPDELVQAAHSHHGPGAKPLRRAAAYVRSGVDSPMESRLRMLLVLAGLPEPVVNHPIRDETGRVRYRLDLAYPQWRIAIEYDGRQHAENSAQWRWDVHRREELDGDGWRLVVVLGADLFQSPGSILDRIGSAAAGRQVSLAARRAEWRRYFPGRD